MAGDWKNLGKPESGITKKTMSTLHLPDLDRGIIPSVQLSDDQDTMSMRGNVNETREIFESETCTSVMCTRGMFDSEKNIVRPLPHPGLLHQKPASMNVTTRT